MRVRYYDAGPEVGDRYTAVFDIDIGNSQVGHEYPYLAMSANSFHPQGIGQHGGHFKPVDLLRRKRPPPIGGACHLGTRIPFRKLPPDCRRAAAMDFHEYFLRGDQKDVDG